MVETAKIGQSKGRPAGNGEVSVLFSRAYLNETKARSLLSKLIIASSALLEAGNKKPYLIFFVLSFFLASFVLFFLCFLFGSIFMCSFLFVCFFWFVCFLSG